MRAPPARYCNQIYIYELDEAFSFCMSLFLQAYSSPQIFMFNPSSTNKTLITYDIPDDAQANIKPVAKE